MPIVVKRDPTEENALKRIAYEAGILAIPTRKRALTSAEKYEFLDLLFRQLAELGLEQPVIAAALHGATGNFASEEAQQEAEYAALHQKVS